jgi:uncharacterized protein YceK
MLKYILVLALLVSGCATREQKQAAADGIAGTKAASALIDVDRAPEAKQVLAATVHYQLAAINEPFAALPAPSIQVPQIVEKPKAYCDNAPPEPSPSNFWVWLSGAALAGLWGIGRVAPTLPGLGPVVGGLANTVWNLLAHKDQKRADDIAATAASSAAAAIPVLEWVAMNHAAMPAPIRDTINPETLKALATLATILSDKKV